MIEEKGSVRVDLLGGTLDIEPINFIIPNTVTLNVATSLKATVQLSETNDDCVTIISKDYNTIKKFSCGDFTEFNLYRSNFFNQFTFVAQILDYFDVPRNLMGGLNIILSSDAPPGSGLGGSSAMGITLYKALSKLCSRDISSPKSKQKAIKVVKAIEARILDSGQSGYQDYYPALYGGVLALIPSVEGVKVEQCYSEQLCEKLENSLTLVYSGENRLSGINNWEVYKSFFDKQKEVRDGLEKISNLAADAFKSIQDEDFDHFIELISKEGEQRKKLFKNITTSKMDNLFDELDKKFDKIGLKVCGAGGGGCFLLIHKSEDQESIKESVTSEGMEVLPFKIESAY